MRKETILVFAAHSDDEVIGCGGTIAKYAEEGKKVILVTFTKGDLSSPWLKKNIIIKNREMEAEKIARFIGVDEVINLGLADSNLKNLVENPEVHRKVRDILVKYEPTAIYTHAHNDPHTGGDHKSVYKITYEEVCKYDPQKKSSLFSYEVWRLTNEVAPRVYVDITKTFKKKVKAMKMFKSQWFSIGLLMIPVFIRAKIAGLHAGGKYGERFYKIR